MIKAAVLGSPITHSLSPKIHKRAYEILGIAGEYTAVEVNEETFPNFFAENSKGGWTGFSLTMPLKEIAIRYCAQVSETAHRINSANTLHRLENQWHATSTDYLAFANLLQVSADSRVAIIGGGGTARAAAGALNSKVANIDVLLRSPDRLVAMARAAPDVLLTHLEMSANLDSYDLIIQSTPANVFDGYAQNLKSARGVLVECLYKPWPTDLVNRYTELGGRIISGRDLLVEQALFQIEIFSGENFDFNLMRTQLLAHISED
ncbi:MAG: shikimate dehydrogenase [Actinomycetales bacterium]|nr:MAG: shikimate dehydrogenase [Actinomycetales bacterium]